MEPLFLNKETSHVKEASYRLGKDVTTWEQDIVEKLHEEHPYLPDYDIKVVMRKTDENSGAGVGQIVVDDDIRIPVIVNDYKLQPLDLMYYNEELLPVTKTSLENITQDGNFGKAIKPVETGGDMGLRSATTPPHYGKYAYAEQLEFTAPELASAISSVYTENGFRYDIADSAYLRNSVAAYTKNVSTVKEASTPLPTLELLRNDSLVDVKAGGVRTPVAEGIVCKLASFDGKFHNTNIFVGTNGLYALCDSVPGVETQVKLASHTPAGYGVYVANVKGQHVSTEPVRIVYKTAEYTAVKTQLGENIEIHQSPELEGWSKIANKLYLSDAWSFAPISTTTKFGDASAINKLAAAGADFTVRRVGKFYIVEGDTSAVPEIAKIANSPVTRVEIQNGFTAYCSPEQVAQVIAEADRAIAAKIKTYAHDPITGDMLEIPKIAKADKAALIKSAGILTDEIVKRAGVDPQSAEKTVDVILGLNFLNKQNIYRLLEGLDDLQVARGVLTRVLLAGRFGLDIDVSTVRTAVFALDAVIKDLRRLRQTHITE